MRDKINKILDWLIIVYVFLLPWQTVYIFDERFINGVKWEFGTGAIFATEILLFLIIGLYIAWIIIDKKKPSFLHFDLADKKTQITLAIWFFLFWVGLSMLWSDQKIVSYYLLFHLLEGAVLLFIILNSKIRTASLAWAWVLTATVQSFLAFYQFTSQSIIGNKYLGLIAHPSSELGALVIETSNGRWLRAYSAFNDPNMLGGFLAVALMLCFWLYLNTKRKKFLLFLIAIISIGLFCSFSRGSILALVIGALVFLISQRIKIRKIIKPIIFVLAGFLIMSLFYWPLVSTRANINNRLENNSATKRTAQITLAKQIIFNHPFVGVGLNNYTYELYRRNPIYPAYDYEEIENVYLLVWAELGIVGLISLVTLFGLVYYHGWKERNYFGLSVLLVLMILGLFYHYPISQYAGIMMLWLVLTVAIKNDSLIDQ